MKTLKIIVLAMIIIMSFSCEEDEIDQTTESLKLDFTTHTNQDQMGDFAENAMAEFNGKVWSFGGVNDYGATDGHFGWSSPNGINWSSLNITPSSLTTFRIAHTLTSFNGELWLIGGEDISSFWYADLWKSADGQHWVPVPNPGFGAIAFHSTTVFNNRMYVIAPDLANDTLVVWSTANGVDWRQDSAAAFPLRGQHKTVVFNDALVVIGGDNLAGIVSDQIWTSSDGVAWTEIVPTSPSFSPRIRHTATVYNGKVWIVGGEDATTAYKNDIWYSDDMLNWTEYIDGLLGSPGLNRHAALVYRDEVYVFGGYSPSGTSGMILSFKEHLY